MTDRQRLFLLYLLALGGGTIVALMCMDWHVLPRLLAADIAATLVVFAGSVRTNNTSCYDPYWSVAPLPIAVWYFAENPDGGLVELVAAALLLAWGIRLTWNFLRGWPGLHHEDWRYVAYRQYGTAAYWTVSLFGLHLFPTLIVFAALFPVYALSTTPASFGILAALGALISLGSVVLCEVADRQLKDFRESELGPGALLDTGVWSIVRNPNYLGEMGFWWGLWVMSLGGGWSNAWSVIGPLGITALFVFVSIPLKETRMAERRGEAWTAYVARTPALLPGLARG